MAFYLSIGSLAVALALFADLRAYHYGPGSSSRRKRAGASAFPLGALIVLLLAAGLRTTAVGTDAANYAYAYTDAVPERIESVLYVALNELGRRLVPSYTAGFLLLSALCLIPVFYVIKRISPRYWISVLVFFCVFYVPSYNIARQMIAAAFILMAAYYAVNKKLINYILCIAVAVGFHSSAIAFVPMYFINYISLTPQRVTLKSTLIFIFVLVLSNPLIRIFNEYIPELADYMKPGSLTQSGRFPILVTTEMSYPVLLWLFCYKGDSAYNKYISFLAAMQIISVIFCIVAGSVFIMTRVALTAGMGCIILVPTVINSIKSKYTRIFTILITCAFYVLAFVVDVCVLGNGGAVPYVSVMS